MEKTLRELISLYKGKIEVLQDIVLRLERFINKNKDFECEDEQEEKVFDEII